MTTRGRAFRYTAISALVVLSLTGFSTGRGHGHGHGGGDGGGCSSSSQDHDSSSSSSDGDVYKDDDSYGSGTSGGYGYGHSGSDYDDDTDGGSGGGSGGSAQRAATVELVSCATEDDPYATVEVTNPNDREYTFAVTVFFKDGGDVTIDDARQESTVPAGTATRVRLAVDAPGRTVDHCELDEEEVMPLT
ncbi:hypothetical protein AB0D84_31315 [Streptomyces sp. NPDC048193]|uniref:hypothetical protein n=1 Tax=unclassified Streptomyces TaxID=2593676 RepID=UPI00341A576C